MRAWMLVAAVALTAAPVMADVADGVAPHESLGTPIDLTAFDAVEDLDELLQPVGLVRGDDGGRRRFYVAPIVGASWGQFLIEDDSVLNGGLLTAGGAAGVAITRPLGQVRIEGEGRYRDGFQTAVGAIDVGATDNWSSLVNVWRDFSITNRLGTYGGGGIGAGGYRFTYDAGGGEFINNQNVGFAWQVGTGLIYALSDRVTLDLGYRYYQVSALRTCDCADADSGILNQFLANELLFAVRIYEPFRGWR